MRLRRRRYVEYRLVADLTAFAEAMRKAAQAGARLAAAFESLVEPIAPGEVRCERGAHDMFGVWTGQPCRYCRAVI